ncbi:MAG: Sterol desaturase [Segetibacter sp.]|nr:Sterol desaturase [Segetibacter sp.]
MDNLTAILRSAEPYAIAISFVAVYIVEHLLPQRKEITDYKHDAINIFFGIFNLAVAVFGGYYLQKFLVYTNQKNLGLFHLLAGIPWLKIVAGFILIDIFMYWWHRANHQISFLWRFHRFHHKDEKLNSTSAVRFHAVEIIFSYVARFCLFPIVGITVSMVVLYAIVLFPVIVFHHSNLRISEKVDELFRNVFVTPDMHRIHHSKVIAETNSNYGSVFPYWDSLFRSYTAKPVKDIEFGVE